MLENKYMYSKDQFVKNNFKTKIYIKINFQMLIKTFSKLKFWRRTKRTNNNTNLHCSTMPSRKDLKTRDKIKIVIKRL